jgi:hypothetical protein
VVALGWYVFGFVAVLFHVARGVYAGATQYAEQWADKNIRQYKFPVFLRKHLFPESRLNAELEQNQAKIKEEIAATLKNEFDAGNKLGMILSTLKVALEQSADEASVLIQ